MSSARHPCRPEQVAALTRGRRLPLAALPETVLRVVAETLVRAWNDLATAHVGTLRHGDENEVSALMESRLNALREEAPCWETLAGGVSRGRESISFDGRHLEKRPDLSVHLTDRNFAFPLVIECKLLDHPCGKTVKLYCSAGIVRFVVGDYAWMAREAFMLAYVRDGSTIARELRSHLAKSQRATPDPYATQCLPTPSPSITADLARSLHERRFVYLPADLHDNPGPVELWHLWLPAAP